MFKKYYYEYWKTRKYVFSSFLVVFLSYSVYIFCSDETIVKFNNEDQFFEIGTAVLFLVDSIIFFISYKKRKNIFLLIFSILMFLGAGEELSWGQVLLNYKTPESIKSINVQGEFNLHNIEIFNSDNFNKTHKKGISRLLEMNFLFRIFIMTYGIIFPLLINHFSFFRYKAQKYRFPVAPLSIGIFFLFSWLIMEGLIKYLPRGKSELYYSSTVEIFEFLTSYIFLNISVWFISDESKI